MVRNPTGSLVKVVGVLLGCFGTAILAMRVHGQAAQNDWPQFGADVAGSGAPGIATGIGVDNVRSLARRQVALGGTVDASAIYLQGAIVKGSKHDTFFVTTTYGKTIAVDANAGTILWEYTPAKYATWAGTRQITNTTPAADPDRQNIYSAAPDGTIVKLSVADGQLEWTTAITLLPQREKIASPVRVFRGHVIAVTGGYVGDRSPYQGHVAILDAQTGALQHVWNSLCSNRAGLIDPNSCSDSRSAIWGRAGAVIDAATGNIFVATGNGPYDGNTAWGDALIELNADATQMLGNFTPSNNTKLKWLDLDVGSTSPALLDGELLAQGGKDGVIDLLSVRAISGKSPHKGNQLQSVPTPASDELITAPAVWHHGSETWLFAADDGGTAAWTLKDGKLALIWKNQNRGTSPIVASNLLYVYSRDGGLRVYDPTQGTQLTELPCGSGHWQSPIVVDGRIALPEGNANAHESSGVLNIWSVPGWR